MNENELAKKIVSKLTDQAPNTETEAPTEKVASIDKTLDLFGQEVSDTDLTSEQMTDAAEGAAIDLFGFKNQDDEDRSKDPNMPAVDHENSDEHDGDKADLEDLDQGEAANLRADDHVAGSGEGGKIQKGS